MDEKIGGQVLSSMEEHFFFEERKFNIKLQFLVHA